MVSGWGGRLCLKAEASTVPHIEFFFITNYLDICYQQGRIKGQCMGEPTQNMSPLIQYIRIFYK